MAYVLRPDTPALHQHLSRDQRPAVTEKDAVKQHGNSRGSQGFALFHTPGICTCASVVSLDDQQFSTASSCLHMPTLSIILSIILQQKPLYHHAA
jgi:hypothetical protein